MRWSAIKIIGWTAFVVFLCFVSFGFAAGLPSTSKTLGSGNTSVSACDTDGVSIIQNLSGANVVSVTIGGIAPACGGGTLSVAVDNGTVSSSGSGAVPGGGGSMTVALVAAVAAMEADEIDLTISGP
jgi:hypothetical protein